MKHFLLLVLVGFGWGVGHSQSFELVDKQDSYQGGVGQTVSIPLKIKNTTDKPQFYIFRKVQDDLGSSRKGYFCLEKNCLDPDIEEFSKRLEPGETLQNLNFTVETGFMTGLHLVKFEIFPRGLPAQMIEHVVSLAIEDRPAKARVFTSREITIHDVYPNPVSDQAFIEYSIHGEMVKAKVVIHNILGKLLGDFELPQNETKVKLQTEDLPSGVYFYTLYLNNEGVLTRKLIVRK
jgi:Secretion system C-terminal sorting domain